MPLMPLIDYKRIRNAIIATVVAALIMSIGSVVANHFNTKFQVNSNKEAIKNHIEEVKLKSFATEEYVTTVYFNAKAINDVKEMELKRRVTVVESKQDQIIKLLHEIKGKLPN